MTIHRRSCCTSTRFDPKNEPKLCAVNHVDDTGRLQTVSREENPLYYELIQGVRAQEWNSRGTEHKFQ